MDVLKGWRLKMFGRKEGTSKDPPVQKQAGSNPSASSASRLGSYHKTVVPADGLISSPLKKTTPIASRQTTSKPRKVLTCKEVYDTTLIGLFVIAEIYDNAKNSGKFGMAARQLSLWGAGLFKGPLALDVIFEHDSIARETLRQGYLGAFAGLLVAEGARSNHTALEAYAKLIQVAERMFNNVKSPASPKVRRSQEEISKLLDWNEMQEQASAVRLSLDDDPTESNFIITMVVIMQDLLEPIMFARIKFSNNGKAEEIHEETKARERRNWVSTEEESNGDSG
ncbi:hypothetical protein MMC28_008398 [Mycoblastus sanguinarius]|nr:hypothetical protein [Mycoblastus sanguinarius]